MTKLNYKVIGEGDPVIILHGLFGMLDNWQTFGKELAKNYTVYLVDQRDHGRSPKTDEFTYKLLAEDIKALMDEHWICSSRFIGHSMGGRTCMHFAMEYPDMVDQMMIVDMGVKSYTGGHESIIQALQSVPISKVKSRGEVDSLLQKKIQDAGVRMFLLKNLTRNPQGGYEWKMNLALLASSYENIMMGIDPKLRSAVDCLFVKGGESDYILPEDMDGIKTIFTRAQVETIDFAGHWVHAQRPEELLKMTQNYFKQGFKD